MVETTDGNLFLMGGKDGHRNEGYNWIFAFDEVFGFYDTGLSLPEPMFEFSAVSIDIESAVSTTESDRTTETESKVVADPTTISVDPTNVSNSVLIDSTPVSTDSSPTSFSTDSTSVSTDSTSVSD